MASSDYIPTFKFMLYIIFIAGIQFAETEEKMCPVDEFQLEIFQPWKGHEYGSAAAGLEIVLQLVFFVLAWHQKRT